MRQYSCDVAVVGGGAGGASAAYHCAKAGLHTILLEACDGFGPALTGVNGIFAVGTAYQKSKHVQEDPKKIFRYLMEHANWTIDPRQVSEFLNRSTEMWKWLESLGCEAEELIAYNMEAPHTWLYFNDQKPRLEAVGKAFLDLGGQLVGKVYMDSLILEGGRVCGLRGTDDTQEPVEVRCKAVVLATGEPRRKGAGPQGMGGPPIQEPPYGIGMAVAAGAGQLPDTYSAFSMNVKPKEYDVPDKPSPGPTEQYFRQPQELLVNRDGVRFTTEEVIHAMEDGASSIAAQPGGIVYSIFDTGIHEYWRQYGWSSYKYRYGGEGVPFADLDARWKQAMDLGFSVYTSDTIAGLAAQMGLDPATLEATVEEYNAICRSGRDTQFYKSAEYLMELKGPRYYAIKVYGMFGQAEGPLMSSWRCEILDSNSHPIPGLYGAGGIISNLNGRIYTHYCAGSRSMFGLTSGMICGESISAYLKQNF